MIHGRIDVPYVSYAESRQTSYKSCKPKPDCSTAEYIAERGCDIASKPEVRPCGYPPSSGARTLPDPPGNAKSGIEGRVPDTCNSGKYPGMYRGQQYVRSFLDDEWTDLSWRIVPAKDTSDLSTLCSTMKNEWVEWVGVGGWIGGQMADGRASY